jgi:hypoxanthine phosphoribosyltransferase
VSSLTSCDSMRRRHPSAARSSSEAFAHPSELVFSSLLSLYGYEWVYEPLEFPLSWNERGVPTWGFRPDFYLLDRGIFIELTVLDQRLVTKKNKKIRRFRELYPEVPLVVVYRRDFRELLQLHDISLSSHEAA